MINLYRTLASMYHICTSVRLDKSFIIVGIKRETKDGVLTNGYSRIRPCDYPLMVNQSNKFFEKWRQYFIHLYDSDEESIDRELIDAAVYEHNLNPEDLAHLDSHK